jgi:hypothetical protein
MDLTTRLLVLVAFVVVVGAITAWYKRRSAADEALGATDAVTGEHRWPALPDDLRGERPATWVIFTTPYCASCNAVQAQLEAAFPHHEVRKVDATERTDLADAYEVRRAPTTIVADAAGTIVERLVGPESVAAFIGATEDPILAG